MARLILLIFFYLFFPIVIICLCKKWSILKKLGSIVIAYGFGLLLGSSGLFPEGSDVYRHALQGRSNIPPGEIQTMIDNGTLSAGDKFANQVAIIQDLIPSIVVPLAFPLLLFSLNLRRWLRFARKGFISVILALISGIVMVTAGFFIWKNSIPESWKLAGMFEGIYTGGTPNFVAIKMALDVNPDLFVIVSTYDVVVGAFLVLFFITIAPRFFRLILPEYINEGNVELTDAEIKKETEDLEDYSGILKRGRIIPLFKALGLSLIIFIIAIGFTFIFPRVPKMVVVILTITTLGILASFIKTINSIEKTFQLGMYFILIFSLTVASMADLKTMFGIGMANLVMFISWCYFGSMFLHLLLAKIFRIDSDNFLITSAAYIFSPPFVPLVANALKNRDLIVTGITGGILGYVLGNYFGVALAYFLKGF